MEHIKKYENDNLIDFFKPLIDWKVYNFINDKSLYFSDKDHFVFVAERLNTNKPFSIKFRIFK